MADGKCVIIGEVLKKYFKERHMTQQAIADVLGVSQGAVTALLNGKPFGSKTAQAWSDNFGFNITWLLTGEGEMLKTGKAEVVEETRAISTGKVIPYYDAEVAAGTSYGMDMVQTQPVGMIEIGGLLKDSEFAMRVYGNSMVPNYPAGCVIGLRQYTERFIEPGTVYVIETSENRFLKRLYYNKNKDAFRCLSDNHMKHEAGPMEGEYFYPEFEIAFADVQRLLRVTGVIKRNVM